MDDNNEGHDYEEFEGNEDDDDDSYRRKTNRATRSKIKYDGDSPLRDDKKGIRCNCKKSSCLKLYCDCFANMQTCSHLCNCKTCWNRVED